jgi:hypothetical protein
MPQGQLAYILFVDQTAHPEHPIAPGGPPPGIWPSPGYPAHPIAPGGAPPWVSHPIPPTVWPNPPGPGIWPPGSGIDMPTHPIYIPVPPPPDSGLSPTHPIYIPVYPAHPIAPGGPPPVVWPGPGPFPHPEHPIVTPPQAMAELLQKIKSVVDFWTGNLPPPAGGKPVVTPTGKP